MTIKIILAAASGGTASGGAVELGCQLAQRFKAHLECFHVRLDPRELILAASFGDYGMLMDGAWIERVTEEAEATAVKTKSAVMEILRRRGLTLADDPPQAGPSAAWREETGYAAHTVPWHARFSDLVVLGRSDRVVGQPHTDVIEETLIHSGRPVLLASAQLSGTVGNIVAIGWNGSPPAVRALHASLPFLSSARTILLITAGDRHEESAASAKQYLAWHSIGGEIRHLSRKSGVNAGGQLLTIARDEGADLLVMGGYGHTPWRELLFGGATREVVGTTSLPVLLSH
jgi:nucleotide-binding universal stress UspA family protein